jgi:hypothetical protein
MEDTTMERNYEADLAEMRSEYRHENDDRYQMSDAEVAYLAEREASKTTQHIESMFGKSTEIM